MTLKVWFARCSRLRTMSLRPLLNVNEDALYFKGHQKQHV